MNGLIAISLRLFSELAHYDFINNLNRKDIIKMMSFNKILEKMIEVNKNKHIFKLTDGSYWMQENSILTAPYKHMIGLVLVENKGKHYLQINDDKIMVSPLYNVIESQIFGFFKGWNGTSSYRLKNGQTWKEISAVYHRQCNLSPYIFIYKYRKHNYMYVDGTVAIVELVE